MNEQAIIGWKAIAEMFNCSERKMISLKEELYACGAIFYMNLGRPPRKRVCAFPSILKAWQIKKSSQGEMI
ncbi:MAG: hypothetical protein JRD05_05975 [Deltaproteobacteria bacterium]|nr:hypothetical protein [Deltaproteobacteria bacterium]